MSFFTCCAYDEDSDRDNTIQIVPGSSGQAVSSLGGFDEQKEAAEGGGNIRRNDGKGGGMSLPGIKGEDIIYQCEGTSSSVITLSPEQKEKEKIRLQALVKAFAKSAVGSLSCEHLQHRTGAKAPAQYELDKALTFFTVTGSSGVLVSFHMSKLQDVLSYADLDQSANTEVLTREKGIEGLSAEEKKRLVVLEYMSGGSLVDIFCILIPPHQHERFVTCMKILRLYAMAAQNPS